MKEHEVATGEVVPINRQHRVVTFKGFSGDKNRSIGVCRLPWRIGRHVENIEVYVVPGRAGLLLSKPLLKGLKCKIDMERDELIFDHLGERLQMRLTPGGHYEVPLNGSTALSRPDQDFQ